MHLLDVISPMTAATAAIVIFLTIVYYFMRMRDIPPGPNGLPYFGLFPYLQDETGHLQLQEFGNKYGDIFTFTYTGNLILNLGSVKAIREAHVGKSDAFAARFEKFNMLTYILEGGVAFSNGEHWKVLRQFFIKSFREFGITTMRDNTIGPVYDSLSSVIEDIRSRKGEPFNIIDTLTVRCTGTMRQVLFGEHGVTDQQIHDMNAGYGVALERMTGINMLLIGPFGKFIFKTIPKYRTAIEHHGKMRDMLIDVVKKIESEMEEDYPTCVVEDFYSERKLRLKKNDATWIHFTDKALAASLAQIVGDGIVSVAYFIGAILYGLVSHPDEQEKIYLEIIDAITRNRLPTHEDRAKLPYTNGFIYEIMRTSNLFPLFPSMECTTETTIRGYRIPKGTITLLNIWQAHHDPKTYENPENFDPSRFVAKDGKTRAELPVLFGIGKRACSGEPFVMMQAFLFLVSIVQNFKIMEPANPKTKSELFLYTGLMELCFTPRKES